MNNSELETKILDMTKDVVKDVYVDTVKPAAKNIGGFLETLSGFFSNVVVYPLKKLNMEYEQKAIAFERQMQEKYNNIPEKNRVEPQLHIVGPAMESLKYNIMQDDLANMFSNLLLSDLDDRTQELCTPAFVKMIEQLSPNDAKVFKSIVEYCTKINSSLPICEIEIVLSNNHEQYYKNENIPKVVTDFTLFNLNEHTVSKSLQHLSALGIIELNYLKNFIDSSMYEKLTKQECVVKTLNYANKLSNDTFIANISDRGILFLTDIGLDFAKVCLRDSK